MRGVKACSVVLCLALGSGLPMLTAQAQAQAAGGLIYTCTNAAGKRLTADHPIGECVDREQRVLNSDGSLHHVITRTLTADERSDVDARAREIETERVARMEAQRADRNLVNRFPDEPAHNKARAKALDDVNSALRDSDARLTKLARERKPLDDEAEFYVGKPLPITLKSHIDANDAAVEAQRVLVQNQKLEGVRINARYDAELDRLRRLWSGTPAGSMGPIAAAASAPATRR